MDSRPDMTEANTDDYQGSAARHWNDATLLEKKYRHANANQLYGLAAECAIKTALCQVPGLVKDGKLQKHRTHIDKLWGPTLIQSIQNRFPKLVALLDHYEKNPFHDWRIDHRYAREGTVSEDAFKRHRDMAKRLLGSVGIKGTRAGS